MEKSLLLFLRLLNAVLVFVTTGQKKYLLAFVYIWVLISHLQLKIIKAAPIYSSSNDNYHPISPSDMKILLSPLLLNPCGFETADEHIIDNTTINIADIKLYLTTIHSSSKTGLSDFNENILKNFLEDNLNTSLAMKDDHHDKWKHRSNPNLHPNENQLEIEFSSDLFYSKKNSTTHAARNFDIKNKQHLLEMLHDCDDRLQRLLVVFFGMFNDLDDFSLNFRNQSATKIALEDYANAINIIRMRLCDVRYVLRQLHKPGHQLTNEASEVKTFTVSIVDIENIYYNLPKADSIGDWVNIRQLHDQLKYMTQVFSIWVNEINSNDPS